MRNVSGLGEVIRVPSAQAQTITRISMGGVERLWRFWSSRGRGKRLDLHGCRRGLAEVVLERTIPLMQGYQMAHWSLRQRQITEASSAVQAEKVSWDYLHRVDGAS